MMFFCATLSYSTSTPGKVKNMADHGGNRTYDLCWNASPMLCQLIYAVRSVPVCDISELSPLPAINDDFLCLGVMHFAENDVCGVTLSLCYRNIT